MLDGFKVFERGILINKTQQQKRRNSINGRQNAFHTNLITLSMWSVEDAVDYDVPLNIILLIITVHQYVRTQCMEPVVLASAHIAPPLRSSK